MKKLNVAVIGAGFWGRNHIRVYKELPNANLSSICEVNSERLKVAVKEYQVKGYKNISDLLKRGDIDAVSICTWATKLAEITKEALKAGKHVLVEKPMANNSKQAEKLVRLAEENDLRLMVGFIERYNPGVKNLKGYIKREEIGSVVSALTRRVSEWPERIGDVGVVKDSAIHDIDILRFLFEEDPSTVYAKVGRLKHKKFEDYAHIMITFKEEKTAFIEANWLTPRKKRELTITGSNGVLSIRFLTQELVLEKADIVIEPIIKQREPLKLELQHFVECVKDGRKPLVDAIDGLKAVAIAEAILESMESGRVVELDLKSVI